MLSRYFGDNLRVVCSGDVVEATGLEAQLVAARQRIAELEAAALAAGEARVASAAMPTAATPAEVDDQTYVIAGRRSLAELSRNQTNHSSY